MTEQRIREILDKVGISCNYDDPVVFDYAKLVSLVEFVYQLGQKNTSLKN